MNKIADLKSGAELNRQHREQQVVKTRADAAALAKEVISCFTIASCLTGVRGQTCAAEVQGTNYSTLPIGAVLVFSLGAIAGIKASSWWRRVVAKDKCVQSQCTYTFKNETQRFRVLAEQAAG